MHRFSQARLSVRSPRHAGQSMTAVWLLIGLALGTVSVAFAARARIQSLAAEAARSVELDRELVRVRGELEHERALAEQRLTTLKEAQDQLSTSFKALSAEALQASMGQLAEMAQAQLKAVQAEAKGDLDKRQQ